MGLSIALNFGEGKSPTGYFYAIRGLRKLILCNKGGCSVDFSLGCTALQDKRALCTVQCPRNIPFTARLVLSTFSAGPSRVLSFLAWTGFASAKNGDCAADGQKLPFVRFNPAADKRDCGWIVR